LATGYEATRTGSHVIFYIVESDAIVIIGVPHGSTDIEAYFKD
jgi:plasmid stabilization system protein ParE